MDGMGSVGLRVRGAQTHIWELIRKQLEGLEPSVCAGLCPLSLWRDPLPGVRFMSTLLELSAWESWSRVPS